MPKGNWQSPRYLCRCSSEISSNSGQVPKKISLTRSLFLRRGGAIHCTVTGAKRYSADLAQGVPCVLKFVHVGDGEILSLEIPYCVLDFGVLT